MLRGARPAATVRPAHVGLAVVTAGIVLGNVGPIDDLDTYWHVLVGREILDRRTLTPQGAGWLGVPIDHWATTQWASELAMSLMVDHGGWRLLVAARVVAAIAVVVALALVLVRRANPAIAVAVLAAGGFGLMPHLENRPQTVALGFLVPLTWLCTRTWTTYAAPPPVLVGLGCLVWAQFHGLWILAPGVLVVTAAGLWLDGKRSPDLAGVLPVRGTLVAAAASLAGVLNPRGLTSFTAPLDFRGASTLIDEWQATTVFEAASLSCAVVGFLVVLGWVGARERPPIVEVLWVVLWSVWALVSYRNCLPADIALSVVAAIALQRAYGGWLAQHESPVGAREGRLLRAVLSATVVGSLVGAAANVATQDPLSGARARPIALTLAQSPTPVRVFNGANAGGQLAVFGGGKVRLAVDGRYDLWGLEYMTRMTQVQVLGEGWQTTLSDFRPDVIVMPELSPLVQTLLREGSWHIAQRSSAWVLLRPGRG